MHNDGVQTTDEERREWLDPREGEEPIPKRRPSEVLLPDPRRTNSPKAIIPGVFRGSIGVEDPGSGSDSDEGSVLN